MSNQQLPSTVGAPPSPASLLRGIVRSVNSGDSLLIQDIAHTGELLTTKQEVLLSALAVPRLGRPAMGDKPATKDDAFAWDSREFLRKKVIGKRVAYSIDYTNPNNSKHYVTAYLPDDLENSLNKQMIESGWATVFRSKKPDPIYLALETEAASRELGVHNKNAIAITQSIRPSHTINSFDLFNKLKGKQLTAFVENIRNTKDFKCVILPSFHIVNVQLSGVQVAGYKGRDVAPEPYVVDGENLVGNNVLHRDVTLTLDTFDKSGNLFGSIQVAGRDVGEELLKQGLGSFVPWSAAARPAPEQEALKKAELHAKTNNLRMWANHAQNSASGATGSSDGGYPDEVSGRVTDIGNSGQLTLTTDAKVEHKIALASIRVPNYTRPSDNEHTLPKEQQQTIKSERYWASESKEWLRKRLIGQKVTAKLDFVRPAISNGSTELPEKPFYSVYFGKGNVSLGLVEAGLARVTEHKGADNRSIDYEALILAENKAKSKNAGVFTKGATPSLNINDCSSQDDKNLKAKASKLLPHIKSNSLQGVIDYVFSAGRFKIYVEKESCLINFSLSSIRVPKRGESAEMDELSNTALLFSREALHQRDVIINIDDVDKGGNFIGTLIFANKNYALTLVEMGYASTYDPMRRLDAQFGVAEERAKKQRLGVWKNYDPEAERRAAEERAAADEEKRNAKSETQEVVVSSVASPTELYVRPASSVNEVEELIKKLEIDNDAPAGAFNPAVGDLVTARFSADNKWYRAKVLSVEGKDIRVMFYDYGNSETTTLSKLKPLASKYTSMPSISYPVTLAFLKATSNEDNNEDAMIALEEDVLGNTFNLIVHSKEEGKTHVVLQDDQGMVNAELLRRGLVKIDRSRRTQSPVYNTLVEEEAAAKKQRVGIWQFGDVGSDDEDDSGRGGRAPRGRGQPKRK
eukprot:gene17470-20845_t